jgi:hypothetical protein
LHGGTWSVEGTLSLYSEDARQQNAPTKEVDAEKTQEKDEPKVREAEKARRGEEARKKREVEELKEVEVVDVRS